MTDPTTPPDDDPTRRLHALFVEAIEQPAALRTRFIKDACGGDQALETALAELLVRHEEAIPDPEDGVPLSDAPLAAGSPGVQPGDRIGRYRIEQRLGAGGFGEVHLAEQTEPVQRWVALKIIRAGLDTEHVIARFEVERQALALMNDPGIAQVFDAGATPEGRPYFVMEYVRGEPITHYCDHHRLDTVQRLELFVEVCNAIQHAHQKGVIHRDIKPGNVLVTTDDRGHPRPKVIDFGIAKATTRALTETTPHTRAGILVGTPDYMPPEQAQLDPTGIDTRSDVYALGALLYELLCGAVPFDRDRLSEADQSELQRIICEEAPPRPSTRLGALETAEATRIAEHRQTRLAALRSTLAGELEWIPIKALRKDRDERYPTPQALAADVRRYLAGEPLEAGPESTVYRFRKLVRRNQGPFIAAGLVALALVVGLIGTSFFALRSQRFAETARIAQVTAEHQRDLAQRQRAEAEAESARAENVRGFFTRLFYDERSMRPAQDVESDRPLVLSMLDAGTRKLDTQLTDFPTDQASVRLAMASFYATAGDLEASRLQLETAVETLQRTTDPEQRRSLMLRAGYGYQKIDNHPEALRIYLELLPEQQAVDGDRNERTIRLLKFIGDAHTALGQHADALKHYEAALESAQGLHGPDSEETRLLRRQIEEASPPAARPGT